MPKRPDRMNSLPAAVFALILGGLQGVAVGEEFDVSLPTNADRWMYPFNATPGTRLGGSVFGYLPYPAETSFDNRDGQIIVAFDTSGLIPMDAGQENYEIDSLVVEITLSGELSSPIDPTVDEWQTYLPATAKQWEPDEDIGRPIELFAAGFRYDYNRLNWLETTVFSDQGAFGTNHRSVFAAGIAKDGELFEVSSNFNDQYTAEPLSVATFPGYSVGEIAPEGAVASFEINLDSPAVRGWVGESLDQGRIVFAVTSLVTAAQGDSVLTQFYLREHPLVGAGVRSAATIKVVGRISEGCNVTGDLNGDCVVNGADLGIFLSQWNTGSPIADLSGNGFVDGEDLGILLSAWGG